jgi:hypothetical protein
LGGSAKCRIWKRILHWRQVDALAEGRLGIRRDREAGDEAIESKKSLGITLASGCMAALFLIESRAVYVVGIKLFEVAART